MTTHLHTERLKNMASQPMLLHDALVWLQAARVLVFLFWGQDGRNLWHCELTKDDNYRAESEAHELTQALLQAVNHLAAQHPDWLEARLAAVNSAESCTEKT